jgi:type IV pilus assembly protein PilN
MPRVNLLPWREELRKQRQQSFLIATMGAVLLGIVLVISTRAMFNGKVDHQNERNALLKSEIRILEAQIKEIESLESVKERTLARMDVIEKLQRSRPEIVHLFDELARAVPDGVHLESVRQSGSKVTIRGVAQSSTRVSAFMRNIDRSEWLTDPGLDVVQTIGRDGSDRASTFTIFATQTRPAGADPEANE